MSRSVVLLVLASAVSPSFAQKVSVDYDHGRDFSRYRTYRWIELHEPRYSDVVFPNELMRERIMAFLGEALTANRLTRVQTGGDLLVGYDMEVSAQPEFTTYTDSTGPGWGCGGWGCYGWGWGGAWTSGFSTTTTQTIIIGTLVVNLTDSAQKRLVFQGTSSDTISSKAEKNTKRLQKGIKEMFEKYPHNNK